ncbi:hypothetical protein E2C01_051393 [Portunus trituberculatus]|uniref:Uncharacterized protein n=1 Tax=Portunus trituberculatus TaxID=210409 RepID=A0A5B7GLP7_PORTR|nr:hypothetical protein [Portunus trituberculatus]
MDESIGSIFSEALHPRRSSESQFSRQFYPISSTSHCTLRFKASLPLCPSLCKPLALAGIHISSTW